MSIPFKNRINQYIGKIHGNWIDIGYNLSLYLLLFSIPFYRSSTSIPIILFVLSGSILLIDWLIYRKHSSLWLSVRNLVRIRWNQIYIFCLLLFLIIYLVRGVFSPTISLAFHSLSIKALLLPVLVFVILYKAIFRVSYTYLFNAFIAGCVAVSTIVLIDASTSVSELGINAFFYTSLLQIVHGNPITFSMIFNIGILFLSWNIRNETNQWIKIGYHIIVYFLVGMVVLFTSKIGYITLFFSINFFLFYSTSALWKRILRFGLLITLFYLGSQVDFVQHRVHAFFWQIEHKETLHYNDQMPRSIIWGSALVLIQDHLPWGVGVGESKNALQQYFEEIGYQRGVRNKFGCHNQFLQSFLECGILGGFSLIILLLVSLCYAFYSRNWIHVGFIIICIMYMMVESIFETQQGIVVFSTMNGLFFFSSRKGK